jgi:Zn-dependent protease
MENPTILDYTKDARVVMLLAAQLARDTGQPLVTPEHVLLGLLRNPDAGAMQTLRILGVPLTTVRSQVEERLSQMSTAVPLTPGKEPPLSEETRAILREASGEARARRLTFIDSSLILVGILLNALLPVSAILRQNGVRLDTFRANAKRESPEGTPRPAAVRPPLQVQWPPQTPRTYGEPRTDSSIPIQISPVFISFLVFTGIVGALLYFGVVPTGFGIFLFVVFGWLISLCLHEFGHALMAYVNGDTSVVSQGYLTLNPFRYTHWMTSILLPILFIIAGGIALPGGAVYVNVMALRTPGKRSLVSAAGPLMNLAFLLLLLIPMRLFNSTTVLKTSSGFWAGLALLAFFQVVALVLNLLPIPGLDGFGIIAPFLPENIQISAQYIARFGMLILFALLWLDSPISTAFWNIIQGLTSMLGINPLLIQVGLGLFRFWQ